MSARPRPSFKDLGWACLLLGLFGALLGGLIGVVLGVATVVSRWIGGVG